MAFGNSGFHPSRVENRIYDLMNEPEFLCGLDVYTDSLFDAVCDMIKQEFPGVEWEAHAHPTWVPGVCGVSFAWVEDGHIHLIGWSYEEKELDW